MFSKTSEDFLDVLLVRGLVLGEDENVIQIDDYGNIEQISEDCIDEPLERRGAFVRPNGITSHS